MSTFSIRPILGPTECLEILHGDTRAAIIYPPEDDGRVAIYPWPPTYPDLAFTGLPAPLKPEWDWHPSLASVRQMLGIEQARVAA
jgi:hypothetical protein